MDVKIYEMHECSNDRYCPAVNVVAVSDFDRVTAERNALQQLLNARDEEIERVKHIARCSIAAVHDFLGNTEHHDDYKRDMAELENQA